MDTINYTVYSRILSVTKTMTSLGPVFMGEAKAQDLLKLLKLFFMNFNENLKDELHLVNFKIKPNCDLR